MINFAVTGPGTSPSGFRLAHISDPHLSHLNDVPWRQLVNKRVLGYLSWRFNRRHIHSPEILGALIRDMDGVRANHLVISGDLTQIGTPSEYKQVGNWLAALGAPSEISVIPGNHDNYVRNDFSQTTSHWSAYMGSDSDVSGTTSFPSLRQRGPLAIIGLSTALPTAPFFATGKLGQAQIDALIRLLDSTGKQGLFRVVVLHHGPLVDSNKFRKRLIDSAQFRSIIKSHGAELILHGHGHYPVKGILETGTVSIPVIGAASASALSSSATKRAGYNIYEVNTTANGWKLRVQSRRYDTDTATFKEGQELEFDLPASTDISLK